MKQFIFAINRHDPAPAGGGDAKSWFFFYKWDVGEEVYVPFANELLPDDALPEPGDLLWFFVEGRCAGYVHLLRLEDDPLNQRKELWYHTDSIRRTIGAEYDNEELVRFIVMGNPVNLCTGPVPDKALSYLERLQRRIDEASPAADG